MDVCPGTYFTGWMREIIVCYPIDSRVEPFYAYVPHQAVQKSGPAVCELILKIRVGVDSHEASDTGLGGMMFMFNWYMVFIILPLTIVFPLTASDIKPFPRNDVTPALSSWMP